MELQQKELAINILKEKMAAKDLAAKQMKKLKLHKEKWKKN